MLAAAVATTVADAVTPQHGFAAKLVLVTAQLKYLQLGNASTADQLDQANIPANVSVEHLAKTYGLDNDAKQLFVFKSAAARLLKAFLASSDQVTETFDNAAAALDAVVTDGNRLHHQLYLGGAGGCGKSQTISCIRSFARSWGMQHAVHVVAPTGAAALNVGGQTIHTHAMIPIAYKYQTSIALPKRVADKALEAPYSTMVVLIMDEVSMIPADLFGLYDACLRVLTGRDLPFGGGITIVSGDFLQLSPVGGKARLFDHHLLTDTSVEVAHWAERGLKLWRSMHSAVTLTHNYRANDPDYRYFLAELRQGRISDAHLKQLKACRITSDRLPPTQTTSVAWSNSNCALLARDIASVDATRLGRRNYTWQSDILCADNADRIVGYNSGGYPFLGIACKSKSGNTPEKNADRPVALTSCYLGQVHTLNLSNKLNKSGLCNGVRGTLVGSLPQLDWSGPAGTEHLEKMPDVLFFKVETFTGSYDGLPTGVIPVVPTMSPVRHLPGLQGRFRVRFFKTRSAESCTLHKVQGLTLASIAVHSFGCSHGKENSAYVAFSRVRNWQSLFLYPNLTLTADSMLGKVRAHGVRQDPLLHAELRRLESLPPFF